jgi:hypothetical protein
VCPPPPFTYHFYPFKNQKQKGGEFASLAGAALGHNERCVDEHRLEFNNSHLIIFPILRRCKKKLMCLCRHGD